MKLIFGLGNPGIKYKFTRHNLGFLVIESLAKKYNRRLKTDAKTKSRFANIKISDKDCVIAKSLAFMNLSGLALKNLMDKYKLNFSDLLVICDDLNLELGKLRLKAKGKSGGHKGLKSIIDRLGSNDFPRLRIGIDRPKQAGCFSDYVLDRFSNSENKTLGQVIERSVHCCEHWVSFGIESTMTKFNRVQE